MASEYRPNILLFGAGSVGAVYLYLLSRVASVTAVCRSNYDVVKQDGFIINSSLFGQDIHFKPHVVRNCFEAAAEGKVYDYILVCSKAIPNTIPELIKPAVTPSRTAIALLQNGIGIEEEYHQAFPDNAIVSCVVYLPTTQRPAGVIKHGEIEWLEIGNFPASSKSHHAAEFVKLIRSSGATAELYDDVQTKRWLKLVVNAPWNPLCALTLCKDTEIMGATPLATNLVLDMMLEVAAIATAHGHPISREQVEYQLGRAKARIATQRGVEPSMLQDVKEGRRIEVEAIVGNAVTMGKDKNVPCEKLAMLYVMAKALDFHIGSKNPT